MKILLSAAALALFAGSMPALAQSPGAAAQPQAVAVPPKPSAKARNAIVALQTAVNSNDQAAIATELAKAQAAAATKDDRYIIGQLQLKAALAANDPAQTSTAIDAIAASGFLDAAKTSDLYISLGSQLFQKKQYAQAATAFERAAAINPSNAKLPLMIADVRMAEGRKADAAAMYERGIKAAQAAGQKPDEALFRRAVQAAHDAKLPSVEGLAKQWVTTYPSPDSWRNSLAIYRNQHSPDVEGTIDVLRLMRANNALTKSNELSLYVNGLIGQSNFIEAQTFLDQVGSTPGVDAAAVKSLQSTVASKPRVSKAELDAAAKSAQSGMALLRIGDRLYGLGEYAKAADTYRAAKGKGADANLVSLRTGIALVAAGDKAGATAAFNAVSGARQGLAQYWLLYLQSKG